MNSESVINNNYRTVFNNMYDYTISIMTQKKNSQWKLTITKTSFVKKEVLEN